jgi:hypothetical protein
MGLKQGWAMVNSKPEMLNMFSKWNFNVLSIKIFGVVTLLSVLMLLFPQTYVAGNFIMAGSILLILCLQLTIKDLKGAAIELPFLLMNLVLIYLQYPVLKQK